MARMKEGCEDVGEGVNHDAPPIAPESLMRVGCISRYWSREAIKEGEQICVSVCLTKRRYSLTSFSADTPQRRRPLVKSKTSAWMWIKRSAAENCLSVTGAISLFIIKFPLIGGGAEAPPVGVSSKARQIRSALRGLQLGVPAFHRKRGYRLRLRCVLGFPSSRGLLLTERRLREQGISKCAMSQLLQLRNCYHPFGGEL